MVNVFHTNLLFVRLTGYLAIFGLLVIGSLAAEVEIELDRDSVAAGNGALLAIRINGKRYQQPEFPEVKDLIIQPRGQSQQVQIINGQITKSITYNYAVGSNTPGDYQIPAITVTVDGKKHTTEALDLKVLDAAVAQPPAGIAPTPPGTGTDNPAETDEERFGFLTVELASNDRNHVYIGEIAPVRIRAWLPQDSRAQLKSGIQPEGKAFTLHNVSDQPQQTTEIKDGKRYTVVTWFGGISATKAGSYPASLSLDAVVAVRDTSAPRPRKRRGGPFDDPFFDSVFDRMNIPMIQKDVTLKSEDQEIEVRPLPTENRPENFSGAVGNFKFQSSMIPTDWKTGEPQQITAHLTGSGNFALMDAPVIIPAEHWKTYPGKDSFTPGDNASFSGSKSFQFSAVPRKGGDQDIALSFSYFDPKTAEYKTLSNAPRKIKVAGNDITEMEAKPAASEPAPEKPKDQLVGQDRKNSSPESLTPFVSRPAFVPTLGIAALLCACAPLLARARIRWENPDRIARMRLEKVTREAMLDARKHAHAGNASGFYSAGRLALQHRLGQTWNQEPQAITLAEVTGRIPDDSAVARFFREADRNEYSHSSGQTISTDNRSLLEEALNSLTPNNAPQ